ncbi:MAG: hypothetical protein CL858_04775 [Cupriavidus sp.]|nr:hypothetical protein [Cupriavidus sp.]
MLRIGHFDPISYQDVLRLSIHKREGDQMAHPAVCIHEWLFLGIRFTFRLLMTMLVVPKVPSGRGFLVLTIACRCRPGKLERQNEQHEDQNETSHSLGRLCGRLGLMLTAGPWSKFT